MIDPALVGVISALTALFASITGPVVSIYVARVQIKASVRSANRQRWIDEFRDTIAKLSGQIAVATQVRDRIFDSGRLRIASDADLHQFEQLIATAMKVRLMVNPSDDEHRRLLSLVEGLLELFRTAKADDDVQGAARTVAMQIADVSLVIIRREWTRVQNGR